MALVFVAKTKASLHFAALLAALALVLGGSYDATFTLVGGSNPKYVSYLDGTYKVLDGYILGVNPQGKDVRVGVAGLASANVISPEGQIFIDENGKQKLTQVLYNHVWEFDPQSYTDPADQAAAQARCCA